MAKPNLAYIPATIGDKVYSILPSDGVGDFDFTRADGSSPTGVTRINAQGLIEEVASGENRLNYSLLDGEVVGCPHLLLEPQRTNSITYSEDFSQSYWIKNGVTINSNQVISPDGNLTADLLTGVSGGFNIVVFSKWSSTNNVASCFAKKGSTNLFKISNASGSNRYVIFNLENGTVSEEATNWSGSIEDFGNGWYRCTAISNNESGTFSLGVTAASESVYIWGAQLEEDYTTSYIKTEGSTVTRAAETCNGSGDAATFNDSEGVLMAEISALADDGNFKFISISDGTTSNRVSVYFDNLNKLSASVPDVAAFSSNVNIKNNNKVAFKYKSGGYSFYVNGFELGTSTSTAGLHSGLNTLNFDFGGGSDDFYGNTKQLQYFDSALSDTELEQLTSWDSFRAMAQAQLYSIE